MTSPRKSGLAALLAAALLSGGTAAAAPAPAPSPAVEPDAPGLQRLVDRVVERGAPGATLLVQDGASTRRFTSGVADLETQRPMRSDDHYRIGSVTKTFMATLALQLVEQGALDLDAPVADHLPDLLPDGDDIAIRHLLNHTSGLFNYSADAEFLDRLVAGDSFRPRELVAYSTRHEVLFPPGTAYSYSNTNYAVLGLLLRVVGEEKIKSQLVTRILQPLGLRETTFPIEDKTLPRPFSHGHLGDGGGGVVEVTSYFSPTWAWAAGAMISTTDDLGAFYNGLLGGDLIGPELLGEMKDTYPAGAGIGSGLGLFEFDLPCGTAFGHDGLFVGYFTFVLSSEDGSHQSAVMINVDPLNGMPPPEVLGAALDAVITGFCRTGDLELSGHLGTPPELTMAPLVAGPWSAGAG